MSDQDDEETFLPSLSSKLALYDGELCQLHLVIGIEVPATGQIIGKKPMTVADVHLGKKPEFLYEEFVCDTCGPEVARVGFDRAATLLKKGEKAYLDALQPDVKSAAVFHADTDQVLGDIDTVLRENGAV